MVEKKWADTTWNKHAMTDAFKNSPEIQEELIKLGKDKDVWGNMAIQKTNDNAVRLYKEHWLKGYKEIPKELPGSPNALQTPASNFKSEINWDKWNKETPDNPQLMKEYNAIEQTSKTNGSWMKNPDGSEFQGNS